ncbi:MAG: hypothetical protein K9I37_07900 [Crocinitomicaceae bacterium]|nr:hypothetical protein [Crocinitomicaceae bacterium]
MLKRFIKNVWLLLFIIAIFILLFSLFQSITFSSISAPKFLVYSIGPVLIIGSSYLHLNYFVKLLSSIHIFIYISMAILLVKLPDKLDLYGHLLLLPVISNFYSSWCALIWHTNSKIRKLTIVVLSIFFLLSCATITLSFTSDLTNKLTLIGGVCALIVSIISNLMIKKEKKKISEESEPKPIIDQEYKV